MRGKRGLMLHYTSAKTRRRVLMRREMLPLLCYNAGVKVPSLT